MISAGDCVGPDDRESVRSRRIAARLALVAVGLVAGLALAEVALTRADVRPDYLWDWHDAVVELDPHVLYKFRGHSRADLNGLGYRDYEFDHDKQDRTRILMMGDSFQFGDNVAHDQTLAKALEQRLGEDFEVFNMGIPGYGPDQSYAQLLREGLELDPDIVVLSLFPGNDFNDIAKNRLYLDAGDGRLVYNSANPVARVLPRFRVTTLLRRAIKGHGLDPVVQKRLSSVLGGDRYDVLLDPESDSAIRKIALMRGVLHLFKETLDARGVEFHVFIIPSEENIQDHQRFKRWHIPEEAYFNNEEIAQEICLQEELSFVSLQVPFLRHRWEGLYTRGNGHLSVHGVELAISHVRNLLEGVRARGVEGSGELKRRNYGSPHPDAAVAVSG